MDAHFFSYQKIIQGEPQNIWHDVIVRGDYTFKEAKQIAEQEIQEMRLGCWALACIYQSDDEMIDLIRTRKRVLPKLEHSHDYRLIGAY